jgi:hypothetical protein
MEKIKQVHISESVSFFSEKIKKKYNLKNYSNKDEPSIFWGMYRDEDINILSNTIQNLLLFGEDPMQWCVKNMLPS